PSDWLKSPWRRQCLSEPGECCCLSPAIRYTRYLTALDRSPLSGRAVDREMPPSRRSCCSPMTAILGISAFYHDAAAALIVDGQMVAAAAEDRFSRRKHDAGFPTGAVSYCLGEAGLTPEQLDYVGFYEKPLLKF